MNRTLGFILGFGLTAGVCVLVPAQAAIIYVDKDNACPGTGTSQNPYCRIQNAFNAVSAGETIRIRDSATLYDENAITTASGTAANPITIEPDLGHQPILRYTGNGAVHAVMEIRDADYWIVRNLTFDGTGVYTSLFAIWLHAPTRDILGHQIIGNTFRNWGGTESQADNPSAVPTALILSGGWEGTWYPTGTLVQRNTFDGNRQQSIQLLHTKDTIIENNEIKGAKCGRDVDTYVNELGVKMIGGNIHPIIRNNTFHDFEPHSACGLPNQVYATWAAVWCDEGNTDGEVSGNTVWNIDQNKRDFSNPLGLDQSSTGIFIEHNCYNWTVKNNIIYNIGTMGLRNRQIVQAEQVNNYFSNTVYNVGMWGIRIVEGKAVVKNNIVFDSGLAQIRVDPAAAQSGLHSIDYNLYFDTAGGNKVGDWGAGVVVNFASWKSACSCDAHAINSDPLFVNAPSDFHLQPSSPARDAGEGGVDMGASQLSPPTNLRIVGN
jgi:hypothetical protein